MSVDKAGKRVRRMFGEIAPGYDRMNHLLSMHVDKYWRWKTARIVRAEGDAPILDICTGTGDLALAFCKATGGNIAIVGADFCKEMLHIAQAKKERAGLVNGRMIFVEADALDLPFEDDYFQIVSVAFGLRNVADTQRGLAEMTRVCRRGGKVAVLEFSMPRIQPIRAVYGWYFQNVLPRIGQWLARNDQNAYCYLPQSVCEFEADESVPVRMERAGLRDVRAYRLTFGIATLYVGRK